MHTVLDLKRKITGAIRSADINQTNSFEIAMSLAKDELLTLIKPISLISEANIENGIFSDETRFEVPFDMNEDYVIGVKRCSAVSCCDLWTRKEDYDMSCDTTGKYNIAYVNDIKYLQVNLEEKQMLGCCSDNHVDECIFGFNSIADNGYWNTTGSVFDLSVDTNDYVANGASLSFTLKGNGELTNNTAETVLDRNKPVRLWVKVSDIQYLQSVELQAGNDSSNYYSSIKSKPHNSNLRPGWQAFIFDNWKETGNVNDSNGSYWSIKFKTNNLDDCDNCHEFQVKLGCMSPITPECFKIKYYSNSIYRNPFTSERIIDIEDDIENFHKYKIILDEEAYLIYYHLVAEYLKMNTYENATASDFSYHRSKIDKLVANYKKKHHNLTQTPSINAYPSRIVNYGKIRKC